MNAIFNKIYLKTSIYWLIFAMIGLVSTIELFIMLLLSKIVSESVNEWIVGLLDATLLGLATAAIVLPIIIKIRQHANNMELALSITSEGYWDVASDGRIINVNDGYCQLIGYSREEVLTMGITDFEAIESVDKVHDHMALIKAKGHHKFDSKHRHASGHLINVEVSVSYVRETGHFVCFIRDMTTRRAVEAVLRKSILSLQATIDNSPFLIWLKDTDGRYITANQAFTKLAGLDSVKDVVHKTDLDLWPQDLANKYRADDAEVIATCQRKYIQEQVCNGSKLSWVETFKTPIVEDDGNVLGTTGFAIDITERKTVEEAVQASAHYARSLIESSLDPFVTISLEGKITDVNYATELVTGLGRSTLIGSDFSDYFTEPEKAREIYQHVLYKNSISDCQLGIRHVSGKITDVIYNASVYRDLVGNVIGIFAAARDISQLKKAVEKAEHLALYDTLTDLPNRRLLNDRLGQILAASKRNRSYSALIFLDLDNFKPINDTHGHGVGDMLLKEAAFRLAGCIRESDTAARFGGDEFVVMLSELGVDKSISGTQAAIVAAKIQSALSAPYNFTISHTDQQDTNVEHRCTASIGVIVFNGSEGSKDDIMKWADSAMYQAKEAGRNLIRFYGV